MYIFFALLFGCYILIEEGLLSFGHLKELFFILFLTNKITIFGDEFIFETEIFDFLFFKGFFVVIIFFNEIPMLFDEILSGYLQYRFIVNIVEDIRNIPIIQDNAPHNVDILRIIINKISFRVNIGEIS